jgi:hypothetical protein
MTSAVETESRIADWQQDKNVLTARQKRRMIHETLTATREKLAAVRQVLADGDERLVSLRADEILSGNVKSERRDTLTQSLVDARQQIKDLEREEQALVLADQTVSSAIREAERQARAQAAERLLEAYHQEVQQFKALVEKIRAANDRLAELDADLRQSGLAESGGKSLVLLARSGAAWNALSPKPIVGTPIHVTDWLAHIDRILGE